MSEGTSDLSTELDIGRVFRRVLGSWQGDAGMRMAVRRVCCELYPDLGDTAADIAWEALKRHAGRTGKELRPAAEELAQGRAIVRVTGTVRRSGSRTDSVPGNRRVVRRTVMRPGSHALPAGDLVDGVSPEFFIPPGGKWGPRLVWRPVLLRLGLVGLVIAIGVGLQLLALRRDLRENAYGKGVREIGDRIAELRAAYGRGPADVSAGLRLADACARKATMLRTLTGLSDAMEGLGDDAKRRVDWDARIADIERSAGFESVDDELRATVEEGVAVANALLGTASDPEVRGCLLGLRGHLNLGAGLLDESEADAREAAARDQADPRPDLLRAEIAQVRGRHAEAVERRDAALRKLSLFAARASELHHFLGWFGAVHPNDAHPASEQAWRKSKEEVVRQIDRSIRLANATSRALAGTQPMPAAGPPSGH